MQLEEIWSRNDGHLSMALSKDLPYNKILRHFVEEFMEKGHISSMISKWNINQPTCPRDGFHDISLQKLAFLFSVLIIGTFLSVIIMMYESMYKRSSRHYFSYLARDHFKDLLNSEIQMLKKAIECKVDACDNPEKLLEDLHAFKMEVTK